VLKKLCLIFLSSDYSSVPENYITTQRGKNESTDDIYGLTVLSP
jgi:hypothetical protein